MAEDSNFAIEMYGDYSSKDVKLISGIMEGGINEVPMAQIEFVSRDRLLDLSDFVGADMGFSIKGEDEKEQLFYGTCISAEYKGSPTGDGHYFAEISPWIWFLTRSRNNYIFQDMNTIEIVQIVLEGYNFKGDLEVGGVKCDAKREYCVQYNETDLDFIKRLLEEDGIYFYFKFEKNAVKMVLSDTPNAHPAIPVDDKLPFRSDETEQQLDHIYVWQSEENVVSGKVTLQDYDFIKPNADLTSTAELKSGKHNHGDYELYEYPGRYRTTAVGDKFAGYQMNAATSKHQVWRGEGNIVNMGVGLTFELLDHARHTVAETKNFMITRAKQYFRLEAEGSNKTISVMEELYEFGLPAFEHGRVVFEAVLKTAAFRMPLVTKKPVISGIQTAVVRGSSGAEIETDSYGRIKVQFHWDRKGANDEKSSCWVRTMMPMTGKNWGAVAIPRVGQEVVIQFEEGNPDRPLCVGMLYNAATMPPYPLPANATRSGVKTNSSKGGNGYNELMFEDKKGDELVRFGAEKDYVQTIQNSAHVRVGYKQEDDTKKAAAQDERSMKVEIENHLDELVDKGDHTFEVKTGKQTLKVKKDKEETIEGKSTQTITKDVKEQVKEGNVTREIMKGNESTVVKLGNYSLDTKAGKIELTAMQSITLKVGPSSIVIDPSGVTIKGPTIKVEGQALVDVKAKLTQVKGDASLILKSLMTMIN